MVKRLEGLLCVIQLAALSTLVICGAVVSALAGIAVAICLSPFIYGKARGD